MSRRALLVGGTGPTGPHMLRGLLDRGFDVQMFHTGRHELPDQPDVPHIHGDPFSAEGIAEALGSEEYDVVIATYGRVRLLADELAGRCRQFLFVGGTPVYEGMVHPWMLDPPGLTVPVREDHQRVPATEDGRGGYGVSAIRRVEDAVFGLDAEEAFDATVFRYPTIYGPRNPHPWEWTIVARALDRRPFILVPDDGRGTHSRCGARNAAHSVLLAVDHPRAAAGKAYNVADDEVVSIKQWAQITASVAAERLGREPVPVRAFPGVVPQPGWGMIAFGYQGTPNCIVDTSAIRRDLGYADVQGVRDGLAEVVEEMLADPDSYRDHPNNVDPFDYATEDRLVAAWDGMLEELHRLAEPLAEGLATMPTPQTASGSGSSGSGSGSGSSGSGSSPLGGEPDLVGGEPDLVAVQGTGDIPLAVSGYFESINAEDWERLRLLLADDVVVRAPGVDPVRGGLGAVAYYASVLADYPEHQDQPTRFLVADDVVTVMIDYTGRTSAGVDVAFQAVDVFTVADGRIAEVQIWYDTLAVRRQVLGQ
ncbi:nuclear transport factor 2 family protein [Euzebya tangerina]|uniref:nuclear transport factor 2 family protein n=1 Tax=Euzebya tangerina TaxID=591198 RepID=UPI000E30D8BD|nr:nuclear transport factor 2 family protein [Euzebya tangerina]